MAEILCMHRQLVDCQWVKGKNSPCQAVKAIFRQSKILTAVAALDTAPMGVILPCISEIMTLCSNILGTSNRINIKQRRRDWNMIYKLYPTRSIPSTRFTEKKKLGASCTLTFNVSRVDLAEEPEGGSKINMK